jgi:tripartite-type tricarboxylate transporter receptor subunit TctC
MIAATEPRFHLWGKVGVDGQGGDRRGSSRQSAGAEHPRPLRADIGVAPLLAAPGTWAQSYPARTVRVIVPYSPGANADLIARIVAQRLAPVWGQQVILDNRPGGATNIGTALAAKSPPDGYTLLLAGPPNAINISLMGKLPYDLMADFAPIVLATRVPNVLAVHPSLPVRTLAELIALARSRPGQLSFASGGLGSANQMAGELLKINARSTSCTCPTREARRRSPTRSAATSSCCSRGSPR